MKRRGSFRCGSGGRERDAMKKLIAGIALAVACCGVKISAQDYTAASELRLPNYRKWVFLGSGLGMSYAGRASKEPAFTNVFAEPAAYDSFLKNGVWPDRTVLIAEMRGSETGMSIAKNGRAQTTKLMAVEGEVKDAAKGGWAFYGFENAEGAGISQTGKLVAKTVPCYSCHEQHAAVDNTFVQFYPTLIETARSKGTYKEGR
jgi:hypothetical protein